MDILEGKNYLEFIAFLPEIKVSLSEWQLVNIKMLPGAKDDLTIADIGRLVKNHFENKEGKIYICSKHELLMLVRNGRNTDLNSLAKEVESAVPESHCEVKVEPPTGDNISKLAITLKVERPLSALGQNRRTRVENVVLIADDDMFMRMLIKKGIGPGCTVEEVIHGGEILGAYKKYLPDILFLDIHMPGKDGLENLEAVLAYDPDAYVIMLSADSSPENVIKTTKYGAKGFLAKPFAKEKLVEYFQKCPTIF